MTESKRIVEFDYVNYLKVVAILAVYLLHASIFTKRLGFKFDESDWFLMAPAWGAVWVFFIVSGFLAGKGFESGRYCFSVRDIARYYLNKVIRVFLPTLLFILAIWFLVYPNWIPQFLQLLCSFLTLSYNGQPSNDGLSATWYVCTLCWLYLAAPVLCLITSKISRSRIAIIVTITAVAVLGLLARLILFNQGANWTNEIYVPFYMNLDLFWCGILVNYLKLPKLRLSTTAKVSLCCLVIVLMVINSRIYYLGYLFIYRAVFPSIYIIVICTYLGFFSAGNVNKYQAVRFNGIYRVMNWFAAVSFGFYLFHSLILSHVIVLPIWSGMGMRMAHILVLLVAFVLTVPFAQAFAVLCKTAYAFARSHISLLSRSACDMQEPICDQAK